MPRWFLLRVRWYVVRLEESDAPNHRIPYVRKRLKSWKDTPAPWFLVLDRLGAGYLGPYGNTWIDTPAHMRSKSFFGAVNERKLVLLRQGLEEFMASGPQMWDVVSVVGPMHADPDTWDKICEVLEDYTHWALCSADATRGIDAYDGVNRLLARPPRRGERRRGER